MTAPMASESSTLRAPVLVAILVAVGVLAGLARQANNKRITELPGDASAGWFTADTDGLYHARRLERALREGAVAGTDPLLNHPHGASIPWPPYYTHVLRALLGPFAPESEGEGEGPERKAWIERAVATAPMGFALLTAVAVALAAAGLARGPRFGAAVAAGCAGATFAWLGASLEYSVPGIGDHHAFATLLAAVIFGSTSSCFGRERSAGASALLGALAGGAAGLLLGSWVGGLVHVALVQAALGLLILAHGRRAVSGLAPFGLAFHLVLAATVLPAVLASPWRHEQPWMLINLSWLHLAQPLLAALVFVPLPWIEPAGPRARRYPWLVAGVLGLGGLLLATTDLAVARSVREGFAWAGRDNSFMAFIVESQPLLWGQIGGAGAVHAQRGYAAWLAVPAWVLVAVRAWRGELGLVVWAVALPPMLWQALVQRRFAEAYGVPFAVVLGLGCAALCARLWRSSDRAAAWYGALGGLAGLVLGTLGQWPAVQQTVQRVAAGQVVATGPSVVDQRSFRGLLRWLRRHTPVDAAVLAAWEHGHSIEWAAERATVATNFGSYVGPEGYLAPWRFFLAEDPAEAEAILVEREASHVLIQGRFSHNLEVMLRLLRPDERHAFVQVRPGQPPRPAPRWFGTLAARMMLDGKVGDPENSRLVGSSLGFLRLVHRSPEALRMPVAIPHTGGPIPAGWIWERVPGPGVTARGAPGETLTVWFEVVYPDAGPPLRWSAEGPVGPDGSARVRVPYASDEANGDGVVGAVRWSMGARSGTVAVPAAAVRSGAEVPVR